MNEDTEAERGVCNGQTLTSREIQKQYTQEVLIWWTVPLILIPPGFTAISQMIAEVLLQNIRVLRYHAFQVAPPELQEGWVL